MSKYISKSYTAALVTLTLFSVVYIHRPFQDLLASSVGLLVVIQVLYLWAINSRATYILGALFIPLYMAHALSIYTAIIILVAITIISYILRRTSEAKSSLRLALLIFCRTWTYQSATMLIDALVQQIPYRLDQQAIPSLLDRPESSQSVIEQELLHIPPRRCYNAARLLAPGDNPYRYCARGFIQVSQTQKLYRWACGDSLISLINYVLCSIVVRI